MLCFNVIAQTSTIELRSREMLLGCLNERSDSDIRNCQFRVQDLCQVYIHVSVSHEQHWKVYKILL